MTMTMRILCELGTPPAIIIKTRISAEQEQTQFCLWTGRDTNRLAADVGKDPTT